MSDVDRFIETLPDYARAGIDPALLTRLAGLEPPRRQRAISRLRTALVACGGDPRVCSAVVDAVADAA